MRRQDASFDHLFDFLDIFIHAAESLNSAENSAVIGNDHGRRDILTGVKFAVKFHHFGAHFRALRSPARGIHVDHDQICFGKRKEFFIAQSLLIQCDTAGAPVGTGNILGIYKGKLPGVGLFFAYVKSTPGYIVCILIPFLLLILYNGVNVIRLFRQYKKEQTDALEAEKAEIAAERARTEQMLLELQALKEQLSMKSGDGASPPAESVKEAATEPAPAQSEDPQGNG